VVLRIPLSYVGPDKPTDVRLGSSPALRTARFIVLCLAIAALLAPVLARESRLGRFEPLTPPEKIDRDWLDAHLLSLAPEEAGALWDETIGPAEVAAVLARLSAERKIETEAQGKKLTMRLLVPLEHVKGYDHELLKAFFFGGRKETDTDAIRQHYKSSGFDPAGKIREGIDKSLRDRAEFQDNAPRPDRLLPAALILSALATLALTVIVAGEDFGTVVGIVILHALVYAVGAVTAWIYSKRVTNLGAFSALYLWVPGGLHLVHVRGAARRAEDRAVDAPGAARAARRDRVERSPDRDDEERRPEDRPAQGARVRARIFQARAAQARAGARRLLVPVRRRARADHGGGPVVPRARRGVGAVASSFGRSSSSSSSSSSGGGWTGGGGAFGGAGASGTWAVAAGALASGVSAPSSSSSGGGGGGGGGGGSSGGGGGGGLVTESPGFE
jgi:uncharacterized membrane protein YgcG